MRGEDFTCAAAVADPAKNHKKITIIPNTVVEEVSGEGGLNYIRYKDTITGKVTEFRADSGDFFGVFVLAGYIPDTKIVNNLVELNNGYIVTDLEKRTSVDGVYAAGDVCIKPLRQIVTATGDGALAATELEKYVAAVQSRTGISANAPCSREHESEQREEQDLHDGLLSADMKVQLRTLFEKMQGNAILKLYLDRRDISRELENYMRELASLSNKLTVEVSDDSSSSDFAPCVKVCRGDGTETGLAFHGVPGGHEFSSFVLGVYNAIGPGQVLDDETIKQIQAINKSTNIKVLVSLSCSMCPDTVTAAQHISAKNNNVTAEVYDIHHFEEIRKKYNVMSVPCILINDNSIYFGKKNISQILELIG
jgi:thioredoxin reductase (NADPH)